MSDRTTRGGTIPGTTHGTVTGDTITGITDHITVGADTMDGIIGGGPDTGTIRGTGITIGTGMTGVLHTTIPAAVTGVTSPLHDLIILHPASVTEEILRQAAAHTEEAPHLPGADRQSRHRDRGRHTGEVQAYLPAVASLR